MAENKTEEEILETDTVNEEASSAEEETKEAGNEASAGETEAKEAEEKADKMCIRDIFYGSSFCLICG